LKTLWVMAVLLHFHADTTAKSPAIQQNLSERIYSLRRCDGPLSRRNQDSVATIWQNNPTTDRETEDAVPHCDKEYPPTSFAGHHTKALWRTVVSHGDRTLYDPTRR